MPRIQMPDTLTYGFGTTVTLHCRDTRNGLSEAVRLTTNVPGVAEAKRKRLSLPPTVTPFTRQVYVRALPSGFETSTTNVCESPSVSVTGPVPGLLDRLCGSRVS